MPIQIIKSLNEILGDKMMNEYQKKTIQERIEEDIAKTVSDNSCYWNTLYLDNYVYDDDVTDDELIKVAKKFLEENYYDKPEYDNWHFKPSDRFGDLTIEVSNEVRKKRAEEIRKKEHEKYVNEITKKIIGDIDQKKKEGYKGIMNIEAGYRAWYDDLVKERDDLKCVNTGQYQLIYDNSKFKEIENQNQTHKNGKKVNFQIKPNRPFYETDEGYFSQQDTNIKKFLEESKKVTIEPNMQLIPFKLKKTFYYLTMDNLTESITLNIVYTAFHHINRQSNLYYQINSAITQELREDYNNFEEYILKQIRSASGYNTKLLKETYRNPSNLLKSKYIVPLKIEVEN